LPASQNRTSSSLGFEFFPQQDVGRHQHARGADATLQRRHFQELLLQRMQMIALGHAFDGANLMAFGLGPRASGQEQTSRSSRRDAAGAAIT